MLSTRMLLRMAKWAKRPPSDKQIKLVFLVLGVCIALFAYDKVFGWPEFLTLDSKPRGRIY